MTAWEFLGLWMTAYIGGEWVSFVTISLFAVVLTVLAGSLFYRRDIYM